MRDLIFDTNWWKEGRLLPSACVMDRSTSVQWAFSPWLLARILLYSDMQGQTHLAIVTEVRRGAQAQTQNPLARPRPLTGPVSVRARRTTSCESSR